ncbi:unnamed protein product, partial [Rotaria sp. Silwood2]
ATESTVSGEAVSSTSQPGAPTQPEGVTSGPGATESTVGGEAILSTSQPGAPTQPEGLTSGPGATESTITGGGLSWTMEAAGVTTVSGQTSGSGIDEILPATTAEAHIVESSTRSREDESKITSINALTEYDIEPIENANPTNPAVVYNPYLEEVAQLDITILKTKDNSVPSKVKLGIFGCGEPVKISAKPPLEPTTTHSSGTIVPSILPEITTSATSVSEKNGTIATTPQQSAAATTPSNEYISTVTVITSSGTTRKRCEETQVVNESVSKKITVGPIELPKGVNVEFQLTSTLGVSFPKENKAPKLTIPLSISIQLISLTLPRDKTPNGNVEQFEVTFYSPDGNKINDIPILSNSSPKEDKSKPAELNSKQIPSNTPVSRIEITIIHTTDDESPKGVVLDIKACTEVTTETTAVTPLSTIPSETPEAKQTGETSLTTGFTGTESSRTEETSLGLTSVSTVEGSTPSYTVITTLTGSTTEAVSGTTTKICEEMQAVDEAVSKKITVKPNE